MITDLTREQASALLRFIDKHGFSWKSNLYKFWQGSKVKHKIPPADAPLLRQIRALLRGGGEVEEIYTAEINQLKRIAGVAENA